MAHSSRNENELQYVRRTVARRAAAQGGTFRRSDLSTWSVDPDLIRLFVRRRYWVRLRHGCYCDTVAFIAAQEDERLRHVLFSSLGISALNGPAYAYGVSAAHLHRLELPRECADARIEIVRPLGDETRDRARRHAKLSPDIQLRTLRLRAVDLCQVEGVPSIRRTGAAFSAAAYVDLDWAVSILDSAAWEHPESLSEYSEYLELWPAHHGSGVLRNAIPLARCGAQTPLESLSRLRLLRQGLPEPELQQAFHDSAGLIGYVDMYWPELRVIGEADGAVKYTGREVLVAEKLREDRLRALGLSVVRWDWNEIFTRPQEVATRIRSGALEARRRAG